MPQEQRKVGSLLVIGIIFIPVIFGWLLLRKGYSERVKVWGLGYTALITTIIFFGERDSSTATSTPPINSPQSSVASTPTSEAVNNVNSDKYAGKIDPSALYPYTTKGGFEKTIKKYGSRLEEITIFRKQAAEKAIDSGKCDSVYASELSDKSTLNHLNFWVDCNNGERIYLDEHQLKNNTEVLTQQELAISKSDAMVACEKSIRSNAQFPSSIDIHHFIGTSYYEAPTTHNVILEMDFDAKNGFGNELPYKAICTFPVDEEGSIEIKRR